MTVRQRIYDGLIGHAPLTSLLAEGVGGVKAGSSLTGRESERPFVIYRCQEVFSALRGDDEPQVLHTNVEIWVYDEPGSFSLIEDILVVTMALVPTIPNLRAEFRGLSGELPDDEMKAITKNVVYACTEKS